MTIICVGDLCCDLIVPYGRMKEALECGDIRPEVVNSLQVRMQCGGSVGNVARHLGKLCAEPVFVTPVCRDRLGEYLIAGMEKNGVDMRFAVPSSKSNMYCVAVLDRRNERTMFCFVPPWADYPRFESRSFSDVPSFQDQILFTSGMAFLDDAENNAAVLDFFKERKAQGAQLVFDLNIRAESYGYEGERRESMEKMIAMSDILLGSGVEEFYQATGKDSIREAAKWLLERGAEAVVARDGGNPILVLGKSLDRLVQVRPVKPVSTLGAGDSFDAMFLNCMAAGEGIIAATEKASDYAGDCIASGDRNQ